MTFEEEIEKRGQIVYKSVGVSMLPWIHEERDWVIIKQAPERLKKYDTVLFARH